MGHPEILSLISLVVFEGRAALLLEFAPIVVGMEDRVEETVSRSDAENPAADGTSEILERGGEQGNAGHVELAPTAIGFIRTPGDSDFVHVS
jgi:hypothetical protein